jgi:hypothetical protein
MSWDDRFEKFGTVKVHQQTVKVYRDFYNYVTFNIGEPVQSAVWSGGAINVTLTNGKVIRYKEQNDLVGI